MTRQSATEPDDDRIEPDLTHAAIVVCCILGLALVAGILPAIDNVGDAGGEPDVDGPAPTGETGSSVDGDGDDDESATAPAEISVRGSTPGADMTVTVERGDERVDDVWVRVDGDAVARTDRDGQVTTTAPYEDSITVSAAGADWEASERVDLETDVTVSPNVVDADDEAVTVTARIDHQPVSGAAVTVDGERVATTDERGHAEVPLERERVEIAVERGDAAGRTAFDGGAVELDVANYLISPVLPGLKASADVTVDGVPAEDAAVTVEENDERARTDHAGSAAIDVPLSDTMTVEASVAGRSDSTRIEGLAFKLAWTVLGTLSLTLGAVISYLRVFDLDARRRHRRKLWRLTWKGGFVAAIRSGVARLFRIGAGPGTSPSQLARLRAGVGWSAQFASALRLPRLSVPSLTGLVGGLSALSLLPSLDRGSRSVGGESSDRTEAEPSTDSGADAVDEASGDDPAPSVRRAWHDLVDRLDVYRRETRTPGQIARRAVDAGYPDDAVRRLTAVFRDVEYGGREPTAERVRAAYEALERIQSESGEER